MNNNKLMIQQMATCAIMAALMALMGPLVVPIGPIPISLTNLVIYFAVYLLGTKGAMISYVVYLLLGAVGLPIFSGYQGGFGKIAGPTGGYLLGFIFMILICGFAMKKSSYNSWLTILGMIVGTAVAYLFGTVWFVLEMQCGVWYALTVCVFPFIPFDIAKIVIATFLGKVVRARLLKANLLAE